MADKILNDEGLATFASEVKGYVNDTVKSANIANLDTLVFKNYYDSNAPIYNIFMQDNKIKLKSWNQTNDTVIPSMITGITAVPTDNSDVANKKYVDDQIATVSGGNIDLTGYATESWVEGKGYTTMTAVEAKGYLTAHQSLANYALKSEIPTIPIKVSAFENDKGYLTAHQSLANYALKSEIPSLTDYSTTAQVQEMISSAIGQIVDGNEVSY